MEVKIVCIDFIFYDQTTRAAHAQAVNHRQRHKRANAIIRVPAPVVPPIARANDQSITLYPRLYFLQNAGVAFQLDFKRVALSHFTRARYSERDLGEVFDISLFALLRQSGKGKQQTEQQE